MNNQSLGESSTIRQLWRIKESLRGFGFKGYTVTQLRRYFPTKKSASKFIKDLDKAKTSAERVNKFTKQWSAFIDDKEGK